MKRLLGILLALMVMGTGVPQAVFAGGGTTWQTGCWKFSPNWTYDQHRSHEPLVQGPISLANCGRNNATHTMEYQWRSAEADYVGLATSTSGIAPIFKVWYSGSYGHLKFRATLKPGDRLNVSLILREKVGAGFHMGFLRYLHKGTGMVKFDQWMDLRVDDTGPPPSGGVGSFQNLTSNRDNVRSNGGAVLVALTNTTTEWHEAWGHVYTAGGYGQVLDVVSSNPACTAVPFSGGYTFGCVLAPDAVIVLGTITNEPSIPGTWENSLMGRVTTWTGTYDIGPQGLTMTKP